MRVSKTALAGTAALALTLSLGACSLSVNGSDSAGSSSPAASQAQKAAWKEIVDTGARTEVSGTYTVTDADATLNLVGDLDTLTIQGAGTKLAAENVGTLIVQGSNVVVYARDIDHVQIQGAGVTVHWLGDDPDVQDQGADNTTGKLTQ